MKWMYRLGLIIAGCYFESAVRNTSQLVLYWANKQDLLQGLLQYLVPVFLGYVFALDVRDHWSDNRLKNDIMAYTGSTILTGYPLLISLSLWFAGEGLDPTTVKIRLAATLLLVANAVIIVLVWHSAISKGYPLSMPWGTVSGRKAAEPVAAEEKIAVAEMPEEHGELSTAEPKATEDNPKA